MMRSVYESQDDILNAIIALHSPEGFDCDVTYGYGQFYKAIGQPALKFDIDPQLPDVIKASSSDLPIPDANVKSLMFDPPFLTYIKSAREHNSIMGKRFGGYWNYSELEQHYTSTIKEAKRVLVKRGLMTIKCQDIIHNHKMHCTHVNVIQWANVEGFRLKDLFILHTKHKMPMPVKNSTQKHARIHHSYFLVFEALL